MACESQPFCGRAMWVEMEVGGGEEEGQKDERKLIARHKLACAVADSSVSQIQEWLGGRGRSW